MNTDDLTYCINQAAFFMRVSAEWHLAMRAALAGGDEFASEAAKLQVQCEIWARSARFWRDLAFPLMVVAE